MTWLWILIAIFSFILLLFLLPVSIRIGFRDTLTLSVGVPGLLFTVLPKKTKKVRLRQFSRKRYQKRIDKDRLTDAKKKQRQLEKKRQKKAAAHDASGEKGKKLPPQPPGDEPSILSCIFPIVGDVLDTFAGKLRVRILQLQITVGGSDAAHIAIMYGIISQGVAYLMEILAQKTRFHRVHNTYISVLPDFLLDKTTADIQIEFRLRAIDLLSTGLTFLIQFLKQKSAQTPDGAQSSKHKEVTT